MTKILQAFTVKGEEVTDQHIGAALRLIENTPEGATFMQIGGAMYRAGVSWDNHDRAADRLLQRLRKSGLVRYTKTKWIACKTDGGI